MNALMFQLELLEPVLATMPQSGEENSAMAYDFIPGSMVRGALIATYKRKRGVDDLMTDAEARRLFFGDAVFLNAYPFHASHNARMLPVPLSWRVEKQHANDSTMPLWDWAVKDSRLEQPQKVKEVFVTATNEIAGAQDEDSEKQADCYLYTPSRQVNVHNASFDRNVKRASTSTVFRYDALAAGEQFAGAILSEDVDALKALLNLAAGEELARAILSQDVSAQEKLLKLRAPEWSIGGSHTAGYGRVAVRKLNVEKDWREVETSNGGERVVITLLSDTIVRDAEGRSGAFDAALQDALGLAHKPNALAAFQKVRVVGGFNRKTGLPLAQEWALQAGSVFVYAADVLRGERALETLAAYGVGARRDEGFGRVAVNWQREPRRYANTLDSFSTRLDQLARTRDAPIALTDTSRAFAERMTTRLVRVQLERELPRLINRAAWTGTLPTNAQLNRVRAAAQRAWHDVSISGKDDGLPAVRELLQELKDARKQFQNARVGGERLDAWLERVANLTETAFRREFGLSGDLPRVAEQDAILAARLRAEFTARWIDGVMKKATLRKRALKPSATKEGA